MPAFQTAHEFTAAAQVPAPLCFPTPRSQARRQDRDGPALVMEETLSAGPAVAAGRAGKAVPAPLRPQARAPGTAWVFTWLQRLRPLPSLPVS